MNTVKARALHSELQDGFDLLRERGRGRYDMELPVFDNPEFNFLTNLQGAAWMPIVREILGDDVVLIHKGAFLSMPGAEAQVCLGILPRCFTFQNVCLLIVLCFLSLGISPRRSSSQQANSATLPCRQRVYSAC